MRLIIRVFMLVGVMAFVAACGSDSSSTATTSDKKVDFDAQSVTDSVEAAKRIAPVVPMPKCAVNGHVLDANKMWLSKSKKMVYIVADSTTKDKTLGDSHRVLVVMDSESCEVLDREVLPINQSADYAYYLAKMNYNTASELIAIRGVEEVYCYDLANQKLWDGLKPKFDLERLAEDAQSGMIQRIELWENYLIGYAQDKGVFVFDLSEYAKPKAVMPVAEYEISDSEYASLFALPTEEGEEQLLLPYYNHDTKEFKVNALLESPAKIDLAIAKGAKNNRFVILRKADEARTPVAIDMQSYKAQEVPADVAKKATKDILTWIKTLQGK